MEHDAPRHGTANDSRRSAEGRLTRRGLLVLGATGLGAAGLSSLPALGSGGAVPPSRTDPSPLSLAAGERLRVRDFGAVGDGRADDTAAVQAMLDESATSGLAGVLPRGTYRCTASLLVRPGTQLHLERGARLQKDWAAPPGLVNGLLRNADFAEPVNGVRITGPGSIGAVDHSKTGVIMALYGHDVLLRDFTIDTYAGGQAIMYGGDRGRAERVRIRNSAADTGTGGIRVFAGNDFRGIGCHVESGDDCLQFVPIGDPTGLFYGMDIARGSYVGCTGVSSVSRFMVALLEHTKGEEVMDASIRDCSFVECRGAGANRGIVVKNTHSTGVIERVSFTDCTVDMSAAADAATQEIRIQTDPATSGAIRDVTFTRTSITRPVNGPLRVGGPNISGLTFDSCTFPAPSGASDLSVVINEAARVRLRRCTFTGAPGKRQLVAGPQGPVTDLTVEECRFTGIPDGGWAVELIGATGARVAGSGFQEAPGATTARAIRVMPTAGGVVIEGNDFTGITHPEPVLDRAADTALSGNTGL
ncbi:glycosyl hydrolase family 28-related protein [Geodermatophilus sp. SYSU D01105]